MPRHPLHLFLLDSTPQPACASVTRVNIHVDISPSSGIIVSVHISTWRQVSKRRARQRRLLSLRPPIWPVPCNTAIGSVWVATGNVACANKDPTHWGGAHTAGRDGSTIATRASMNGSNRATMDAVINAPSTVSPGDCCGRAVWAARLTSDNIRRKHGG